MLFDWWAADFCTAPDVAHLSPEDRANPSRASWADAGYLSQQQRRPGKITHQSGEHDDWATACALVVEEVLGRPPVDPEFTQKCLEMGSEVVTPWSSAPLATVGMRRSAVRAFERAGVPRSVAMSIVGHKTESIYRRYAIVDEAMQREAAARLDAWGQMPQPLNSTGTVTAFRTRTGSERDQSGISGATGRRRRSAKS